MVIYYYRAFSVQTNRQQLNIVFHGCSNCSPSNLNMEPSVLNHCKNWNFDIHAFF